MVLLTFCHASERAACWIASHDKVDGKVQWSLTPLHQVPGHALTTLALVPRLK